MSSDNAPLTPPSTLRSKRLLWSSTLGLVLIGALAFFFFFHYPKPLTDLLKPSLIVDTGPDNTQVAKVTAQELLEALSWSESKVQLVNIWATWCEPCREEFPHLLRLRKELPQKDFELHLVSADGVANIAEVHKFLSEQGVQFLTYIKHEDDMSFIEKIYPDWSGALPATLIFNQSGEVVSFWQGDATYKEFLDEVRSALKGLGPMDAKPGP